VVQDLEGDIADGINFGNCANYECDEDVRYGVMMMLAGMDINICLCEECKDTLLKAFNTKQLKLDV